MFKAKFKIIEIRESGAVIEHYLSGSKKDVKHDIEIFKRNCRTYIMFGKEGMTMWV